MKTRYLKTISLSLLAALMATGCRKVSKGEGDTKREITDAQLNSFKKYTKKKVDLKFYHAMGKDNQNVITGFIEGFTKLYPNVTIEQNQIGDYPALESRVKADLLAGGNQIPDLVQAYPDHLANYLVSNKVIRIDGFMESENPEVGMKDFRSADEKNPASTSYNPNNYDINDFVPQYMNELKGLQREGQYGLPFNKSSEILIYNKTMLTAAGFTIPADNRWTWADVEAAATAYDVHKKKQVPAPAAGSYLPFAYDSASNLFITLGTQYGGIDSYTVANAGVDKPKAADHVRFHQDNAFRDGIKYFINQSKKTEGFFNVSSYFGSGYGSDKFKTQDVGLMISSSGGLGYNIPAAGSFEMGIAPIPQISLDKSNEEKVAVQQGTSISMLYKKTKDTKMDEMRRIATYLFMRYMTSTTNTFKWAKASKGYVPVRNSTLDYDEYQEYLATTDVNDSAYYYAQGHKAVYAQNAYMKFNPAFVGSSTLRNDAEAAMVDMLTLAKNTSDIDKLVSDYLVALYDKTKGI